MINIKNLDIYDRSLEFAFYILKNKSTIRETAKFYGVSKSTVHIGISKYLKKLSPSIYLEVQQQLKQNVIEGRIKGGTNSKINSKKKT